MPVFVTRPFLPPKEEYLARVTAIFERAVLTNQGPEVQELEERMRSFLGVAHFHYVANGTVALQLALSALGITGGEIITTPFTYVATTSAILWERCQPVYVDIEPERFTIDPEKIEGAITPRTRAIMPVHVFGHACDVRAIEDIARRHRLRVIYDAAHAFAVSVNGRSLASYGDISTLSFHATKLFHTLEGGACVVRDPEVSQRLELAMRFGHEGDNHLALGINAKQDELNAAMGNVNLDHIERILADRRMIWELYESLLPDNLQRPGPDPALDYNYAYFPVLFPSEDELLASFERLERHDIFPRRYFYPSLNTLPYLGSKSACPVAEDISRRIACLPLHGALDPEIVRKICDLLG